MKMDVYTMLSLSLTFTKVQSCNLLQLLKLCSEIIAVNLSEFFTALSDIDRLGRWGRLAIFHELLQQLMRISLLHKLKLLSLFRQGKTNMKDAHC